MSTWPASLPQSFLLQGFSIQKEAMSIESSVDYGPTIQRRRYSAASEIVNGRMLMTLAQWATVQSFKETTLLDVAQFTWIHPITAAAAEVRFVSKDPTALQLTGSINGTLYLINLKMRFLA